MLPEKEVPEELDYYIAFIKENDNISNAFFTDFYNSFTELKDIYKLYFEDKYTDFYDSTMSLLQSYHYNTNSNPASYREEKLYENFDYIYSGINKKCLGIFGRLHTFLDSSNMAGALKTKYNIASITFLYSSSYFYNPHTDSIEPITDIQLTTAIAPYLNYTASFCPLGLEDSPALTDGSMNSQQFTVFINASPAASPFE